ncbi:hypothetical protein ASPSYDRAFT_63068 [Aspergillus sydowii CBS 593.65]|uniref:RRM domain-containing protein n=1 Tax=Aspergillus sydowii CBS 593.65 TaxID=1036612 RepID=A0A1L9SXP7_9EURO|nr:uncharacterized protein ASPSYDRAFT_63068 [Aspergillus sydowii CBS 593.65]OJJ51975.1 hypothetical protein ASPSYDRAFT_63068 [Aspergillus sydowii CBS 593.65]
MKAVDKVKELPVDQKASLDMEVEGFSQPRTICSAHSASPPRPGQPSIHPNHNPGDDIPSSHQLSAHDALNTSNPYVAQPNNRKSNVEVSSLTASTPGMSLGAGSHSPHPAASFQQSSATPADIQGPAKARKNCCVDNPLPLHSNDDTRWGIYVQEKYDLFLHDERIHVTEGLWDRFPYGSRLFVGNLPTERVTKRDLFHIFHSYGKLVQISIKQGYGFIQFLEATSCRQALKYEQGAIVRGRKPRRSIRPAPTPTEPSCAAPPHRSKSHNCTGSQSGAPSNQPSRSEGDCYGWSREPRRLRFSDFRDGPSHCRRDDYRPPRSPSPRGYRSREEYLSRDQTPEQFDQHERRRSRSPCRKDRRDRGPSPQGRATRDSDANLPIPRWAPREVPDVQILVIEELDRNFVYHVETRFWNRGLRVDVLALGSQISLDAAVKRQASEGVLAVIRLSRPTQLLGVDNIRSNEYPDLEPSLAADIVFRALSLQRNNPNVPLASPPFGVPISPTALLPPPVAPTLTVQPHLANPISHLDGAALRSLLAAVEQRCSPVAPAAQQPFPATDPRSTPDLASFLSAATRQSLPQNSPRWPLLQQQLPLQGRTTTAISCSRKAAP